MGREEEVRMIAYGLRIRDGNQPRSFLERWLEAEAIWKSNHKALAVSGKPNRPITYDDEIEEEDLAAC